MAKADLTAERLRELFDYNQETGVFTRKVTVSSRALAGRVAGTVASHGYLVFNIDYKLHTAHRLAWLYVHGEWPEGVIDHINGDKTDNRISNLRDVSQSTNIQNQRGAPLNSTTGFLGVCYDDARKKWRASIFVNGKQRYLGRFSSPEEARQAYLAAKRKLHEGCTI